MSAQQQAKNSESKSKSKFQSLNINNIYQGAANKPTSKNLPPKHGLQSLGKVPTARRAPVNLPSEKSENGGNDPSVVLVPSGGGWANKETGKKEVPVDPRGGGAGGGHQASQSSDQGQAAKAPVSSTDVGSGGSHNNKQGSPPNSGPGSNKGGAKSWSSVTGSGQSPGQDSGRRKNFLHQKSPLFGQEFPSLPGEPGHVPAGSQVARETMGTDQDHLDSRHQPPADVQVQDPAYGPGPNLRPQTFGTWTQGGAAGGGNKAGGGGHGGLQTEAEADMMPILPPQPHKPQPPPASGKSHGTTQFKSIMPSFMEGLELPTGPPQPYGNQKRSSHNRHNQAPRHNRDNRPRPDTTAAFTNHVIIDKEKLERMDDLDNGNDWTYEDDDFDYNKKLESDDDDAADPVQQGNMADPNWADQVPSAALGKGSQHYNFYDEFKTKPVVGFDDEERRRTKKSEEVMKNIERARQRREEEENRYRQQPRQEADQREGGGHYRENYRYRGESGENGGQRSGGDRRGQPRNYDERFDRDNRYYETGYRDESGYKRKEEYRGGRYDREDDRHREGWDNSQRSYNDREISPAVASYQRHDSELSAPDSLEDRKQNTLGSASPEWGDRSVGRIQDWVEDVETEDGDKETGDRHRQEADSKDHDRPSRPNSRDSRVSKESRGSKGSRASRDRETNFGIKKDEKIGKFYGDNEKKSKNPPKQSGMQDIRGYFRDDVAEDKKQFRHAPGPITKEKLESFEMKESMTQLSKRGSKPEEKKDEKPAEKVEPTNVLSSLLDSDLLENISEDDDILDNDDTEEKEVSVSASRGRGSSGRGRGRGGDKDQRQFVGHGRGGKIERSERGGGRGGRGGRGDGKRGGGNQGSIQNKWNEVEESGDVDEEKKIKKPEALMANPQQNPTGFLPRGQPSRRGRGEGRIKQGNVLGRQKMGDFGGHDTEIGDWSEDKVGGRQGKVPPRMQKGKKDGMRPGSGNGGEEVEEWETASETSLEEREKRSKSKNDSQRSRGGGRGGRGGGHQAWTNDGNKDRRGQKGGSGNAGGGSQLGSGGSAVASGQEMGPTEEAPEANQGPVQKTRAQAGIENFDLNDYGSVHVVDQDSHWTGVDNPEADYDQHSAEAEGFMQVVNKKIRGPPGPGTGHPPPNMRGQDRDRRGQDMRMMDKKLNNKNTYDRRQSKLPPRLAKQREVAKAQARSGPGQSPSPGTENGWPEGDKMGVFNVDTGTGAWEKPHDGVVMGHGGAGNLENGTIQNTIVFENTAFKGGKSDKMDKAGPIQLPLSFSKQDADNGDLKLDFTFGGEENCLNKPGPGQPPLSIPKSLTSGGLPASPSTDDLQTKLANTKKLWDAPGMPVVPENSAAGNSWNEADLYGNDQNNDGPADKTNDPREAVGGNSPHTGHIATSNIAKVKPQQQLAGMDGDNRANNAALQYSRMAVPSPPGSHSLPPSQLTPLQPWSFLHDASRTSPMYNPYSPLNQSILMPGVTGHNLNTDLFNSHNTLRGVQTVPTFPGSGLTTTNQLMQSQANMINSQVKLGTGIGPIGTKAGQGGPGPSSPYLANLPNTANSNIFIQYDSSGNPLNYMPGQAPPGRGNPPSQTAFYQSLAAANRHQYQALANAQLRASAVAGMPFLKNDQQAKSPVSINDTGFNSSAVPPYNGRATNPPPAGPPSPKTKLKMAQQQEQAKITAGINNLNINNLNALAQMQRSMQLGHFNNLSGLVQQQTVAGQYNPSPIARPQVSHSQGPMMSGGQLSKQMNQYFNQDGGETAKYDAGEETLATDKVDTEEVVEELCESVADSSAPAAEQEAGVAN